MSFEAHDPQALDHWYWLGTQIRCALDPDEPRLLDQYLGEARYLAGWEGVAAWPLFEKSSRSARTSNGAATCIPVLYWSSR